MALRLWKYVPGALYFDKMTAVVVEDRSSDPESLYYKQLGAYRFSSVVLEEHWLYTVIMCLVLSPLGVG
jgi:hypothetical protein